MNEKQKLELLYWPDVSFNNTTNWESTIIENKLIVFIAIHQDETSQNPCEEWDGFGDIRSLNRNHSNSISIEEVEGLIQDETDKEQTIPLSYFEHGNCLWGVKGTMNGMPDFNWDGVGFAGVWLPDLECIKTVDHYEKEAKEKGEKFNRNDKFKEMATQACKTYTAYCNGEVYGFRLELFRLQFDGDGEPIEEKGNYDHLDILFEDSCWGFYDDDGMKHMKETIVDGVKCHLKDMKTKSSFDLDGNPNYDNMKKEDYDRLLQTIVGKTTTSALMAIEGIYDIVSEHFNNNILTEWEKEQLK
jgi:hypothetical protein